LEIAKEGEKTLTNEDVGGNDGMRGMDITTCPWIRVGSVWDRIFGC
jgi:hypothetical protein